MKIGKIKIKIYFCNLKSLRFKKFNKKFSKSFNAENPASGFGCFTDT
jgi:hypothetical protein